MNKKYASGLVWLRRDLRAQDNPALQNALRLCAQVHCAFVFDRDILDPLPRTDRRVAFIRASLVELDADIRSLSANAHAGVIVLHAVASDAVPRLAQGLRVDAVFAAHDYEPQAIARDQAVAEALQACGIAFLTCKDHVVFERREILTQGGNPYGVFTPYLRNWLTRLAQEPPRAQPTTAPWHALAARPESHARAVPTLAELGFSTIETDGYRIPSGTMGANQLLSDFAQRMDVYDQSRNYPAVKGPSYLGVHLRFGTLSIRQAVAMAWQRHQRGSTGATVWLSELAWRDFYFQILANFPHVAHAAFKPEYDHIIWECGERAKDLFAAWCDGKTGYPLVDAAMLQLNQTGYMHNRLRMVAGSFLVKHLGIDWRWGERYFAEKLNDFELASNNGGWQWVSSSGCDAQPYFRIFNPVSQSEKFDAQGKFIQRYLPQLAGLDAKTIHAPWRAKPLDLAAVSLVLGRDYPLPIVDHSAARDATLRRYAVVKKTIHTPSDAMQ